MPIYLPLTEWANLWLTRPAKLVAFPQARAIVTSGKAPSAGLEETPGIRAMNAQELLQEISDYCRQTGLAESTFGRRAVNDGKLASRLRHGGRITTETLDRIRAFMTRNRNAVARPAVIARAHEKPQALPPDSPSTPRPMPPITTMSPTISPTAPAGAPPPATPIRNAISASSTTGRSTAVRQHLLREVGGRQPRLARTHQHPSAAAGAALFDAGVGDGGC